MSEVVVIVLINSTDINSNDESVVIVLMHLVLVLHEACLHQFEQRVIAVLAIVAVVTLVKYT